MTVLYCAVETNIPVEQKAQKHIEIWYTIDVFQSWKDYHY